MENLQEHAKEHVLIPVGSGEPVLDFKQGGK